MDVHLLRADDVGHDSDLTCRPSCTGTGTGPGTGRASRSRRPDRSLRRRRTRHPPLRRGRPPSRARTLLVERGRAPRALGSAAAADCRCAAPGVGDTTPSAPRVRVGGADSARFARERDDLRGRRAPASPTSLPDSPLAWPVPAGVDVSIVIPPEASVAALEPEEQAVRPRVAGSERESRRGRPHPVGGRRHVCRYATGGLCVEPRHRQAGTSAAQCASELPASRARAADATRLAQLVIPRRRRNLGWPGAHHTGPGSRGPHDALHACRPRPGAADTRCTGAEPAQHIPIIYRPPWLRAVVVLPAPLPPWRGAFSTARRETDMKRAFLALAVAFLLLLVAGVGTAAASPPATQGSGQLAGSDQDAGAAAGTAQQQATNENSPVRVLSPGDDGVGVAVERGHVECHGREPECDRADGRPDAGGRLGLAGGRPVGVEQPGRVRARVHAPERSVERERARARAQPRRRGSVSQSNDASSDASAGNANVARADGRQEQAGGSCCGGAAASRSSASRPTRSRTPRRSRTTVQEKPSNENVSVRVLSPGDDGAVSQSNDASSDAEAGNLNVDRSRQPTRHRPETPASAELGEQVIGQAADERPESGGSCGNDAGEAVEHERLGPGSQPR